MSFYSQLGYLTSEVGFVNPNFYNDLGTLTSEFGFISSIFYNDLDAIQSFRSEFQFDSLPPPTSELGIFTSAFQFYASNLYNDLPGIEAEFIFRWPDEFVFSVELGKLSSEFAFDGIGLFAFDSPLAAILESDFTFIKTPDSVLGNFSSEFNFAIEPPFSFDVTLGRLRSDFTFLRQGTFYFDSELGRLENASTAAGFSFDSMLGKLRADPFIFKSEAALNPVTYSFNIANDAISNYDNWGFIRLVRFKGAALGIKEQNLYTIEGSQDDGDPIFARGVSHFTATAETRLARVYALYINLITNGDMNFGVMPNAENLYKYRLPQQGRDSMQNKRTTVGRGLIGTEYAFMFENVAGSNFFVQYVQMLPKELVPRV